MADAGVSTASSLCTVWSAMRGEYLLLMGSNGQPCLRPSVADFMPSLCPHTRTHTCALRAWQRGCGAQLTRWQHIPASPAQKAQMLEDAPVGKGSQQREAASAASWPSSLAGSLLLHLRAALTAEEALARIGVNRPKESPVLTLSTRHARGARAPPALWAQYRPCRSHR